MQKKFEMHLQNELDIFQSKWKLYNLIFTSYVSATPDQLNDKERSSGKSFGAGARSISYYKVRL